MKKIKKVSQIVYNSKNILYICIVKNKCAKMRTAGEIQKWLHSRRWYQQYYNNLINEYGNNIDEINMFLRGEKGHDTIGDAFLFSFTPQKEIVWFRRLVRFHHWYNNKWYWWLF